MKIFTKKNLDFYIKYCLFVFLLSWVIYSFFNQISLSNKITEANSVIGQMILNQGDFSTEIYITLSILEDQKTELQHKTDILEGKVDLLDNTVDVEAKHQAKVDLTVLAIKQTLPKSDNPHKGCRAKPSQGEMRRIAGAVIKYSEDFAVPSSLVLAIIRQESIFCNAAISVVGARGYMQMMPKTAIEVAVDIGKPLKTWRGRDNIHMGAAYIGTLLAEFNGDINLAIRAYNGGPSHVKRVNAGRTKTRKCDNGYITNYYCETEQYAHKVINYKEIYEKFGLF